MHELGHLFESTVLSYRPVGLMRFFEVLGPEVNTQTVLQGLVVHLQWLVHAQTLDEVAVNFLLVSLWFISFISLLFVLCIVIILLLLILIFIIITH